MFANKEVDIGLGCVTFGREIDQLGAFSMMDYAFSRGINLFDTAAAYHYGASESIIGKWLASRQPDPNQILVATKASAPYSVQSIMQSIDGSLNRLKRDALDIFYLHSWDSSVNNIDVLKTLDQCVKKGEINALGASNFTADQLEEVIRLQQLNGLPSFKYIQNNHNLAVSDLTETLLRVCTENQIEVLTYSPLGAGFLTGKYDNGVLGDSRFERIPGHQDIYFTEQALKGCKQLSAVARATGYRMEHLALAWALHQQGVKSVLVGGRTTEQLEAALVARTFYDEEIFKALEKDI